MLDRLALQLLHEHAVTAGTVSLGRGVLLWDSLNMLLPRLRMVQSSQRSLGTAVEHQRLWRPLWATTL